MQHLLDLLDLYIGTLAWDRPLRGSWCPPLPSVDLGTGTVRSRERYGAVP
jgi:hypothetical protein